MYYSIYRSIIPSTNLPLLLLPFTIFSFPFLPLLDYPSHLYCSLSLSPLYREFSHRISHSTLNPGHVAKLCGSSPGVANWPVQSSSVLQENPRLSPVLVGLPRVLYPGCRSMQLANEASCKKGKAKIFITLHYDTFSFSFFIYFFLFLFILLPIPLFFSTNYFSFYFYSSSHSSFLFYFLVFFFFIIHLILPLC